MATRYIDQPMFSNFEAKDFFRNHGWTWPSGRKSSRRRKW